MVRYAKAARGNPGRWRLGGQSVSVRRDQAVARSLRHGAIGEVEALKQWSQFPKNESPITYGSTRSVPMHETVFTSFEAQHDEVKRIAVLRDNKGRPGAGGKVVAVDAFGVKVDHGVSPEAQDGP